VVRSDACTVEDRSLYSYRRDGTTGRQAGLVWLSGSAR
jgi:polyphenol oxidase